MRDSVHDNWVYAQSVDYDRRRVVLYTVYPHVEPPEYTDVVFEGVTAVHFELHQFSRGLNPGNVLFDAEEAPARQVLEEYLPLLEQRRNYGWPAFQWTDLDDLTGQLTAGGTRCFHVHGSCGLSGFVFARSMEFHRREARAELTEAGPSASADRGGDQCVGRDSAPRRTLGK